MKVLVMVAALLAAGLGAPAVEWGGSVEASATSKRPPRPGVKEFGPYDSYEEAEHKAEELKRRGWRTRIKERGHKYYVRAWKPRR
jgi:hypothetical protein